MKKILTNILLSGLPFIFADIATPSKKQVMKTSKVLKVPKAPKAKKEKRLKIVEKRIGENKMKKYLKDIGVLGLLLVNIISFYVILTNETKAKSRYTIPIETPTPIPSERIDNSTWLLLNN